MLSVIFLLVHKIFSGFLNFSASLLLYFQEACYFSPLVYSIFTTLIIFLAKFSAHLSPRKFFQQINFSLLLPPQMITLGGDAELELVDSLDPFSEGIVFSVRPPKKSWKNISNLSGGEKTLSSLALVRLKFYKLWRCIFFILPIKILVQ